MYNAFIKIFSFFIFLSISNLHATSEGEKITLRGKICDAYSKLPIADARIEFKSNGISLLDTQSDVEGLFSAEVSKRGKNEMISITHPLYEAFTGEVNEADDFMHIHLRPLTITLHTMTVTAQSKHTLAETAVSTLSLDRRFFQKNNASTLSAALDKLPGIASMNIGAGLSKPLIRGMGFNRMAVVDKGIVVQNQQWGADHGLELDRFDVDRLIVSKGPMSLFYGSDAMGGVIEILPADMPAQDQTWGDATATAKSNNDLIGASVGLNIKSGNWFYRMRTTALIHSDFRIPTDTINYLTWKMPIDARRMKNTAGKALNLSASVMFKQKEFTTAVYLSNNYTKNGFFPGAHGIPNLRRLQFDGSHNNIELPYSTVNHFKVSNTTDFPLSDDWHVHTDAGFQDNHRFEMAQFHTHFPNQPEPEKANNMELAFQLQTFSANAQLRHTSDERWEKSVGISTEYQINRIGGYSFLMPDFKRFVLGIFGVTKYKINPQWELIGGGRFDIGRINTRGFYDTVLEEYFLSAGYDSATAASYAQRAYELSRRFSNLSGAAGVIFRPNKAHTFKVNLGRGFRFPTPNELSSNGVHHGAFRYERGNAHLQPETSLQLDLTYEYNHKMWRTSITPFINYFSNYIYLNPTGRWALLPHTGQQYEYSQSKAVISGGEIDVQFQANDFMQLSSNIEYSYTLNLNAGYALPFSPPTRWTSNAVFSAHAGKVLTHLSVDIEMQKIFAQNSIAANEEKTPAAWLFSFNTSLNWQINNRRVISELQVYNLFNSIYFNHLSYYRKLNAPEPGRDIRVLLKFPF